MNALELADKLEQIACTADAMEYGFEVEFEEAATMLRQQQAEIDNLAIVKYLNGVTISKLYAEIEALKAGKIRAYDNGVEDGRKPNTNPVKEELTDEEIKFIAYPFESVYTTYDKQTDTDTVHARFDQLGFARAILRKAQEK